MKEKTIMLDSKGRIYGSTAKLRRYARKASRREAKLQLLKGIEPAPRHPRDRRWLD
ncbi:hypothetical protein [Bifidobacterium felsineum]|uniref:hypothetical protein n=1 Tax=Bifidobacterium felsineum TaxID=2045440 RepID=UPI001BDD4409|nr:hypothetical protein [Bifidobacterium felsineum]MBT1164635.1 hypothetical protein [Bifidobacterium felsineum]